MEVTEQAVVSLFSWISFFKQQQPSSGSGPPLYRKFTITLRHTTLGRTPLEK